MADSSGRAPDPSRMTSAGYGFDKATSTPGERMPWSRVDELLAGSRNYWIITTRQDGRPHAAPVWGVWREGVFYFATDRRSRKARNLAANPELVVHLESGDEVVILEGNAEEIAVSPLRTRLVEDWEQKYKQSLEQDEPTFVHYVLRPRRAFSWLENEEFPEIATRWSFPDR